jgi:cytosine/adenosine deaminase-related metal-dependent hydrolase
LRLRARWVVPVEGEPIKDGEVIVDGERIAEVREAPVDGRPVDDARDFGDAILVPGLVNVHAHIDYTLLRGLLEDIAFFPWIRELTARKAALDEQDWIASATVGAAEAVAGGVTTLGDCTDSGAAMMGAKALGLRGVIFQEVFGIDESQAVPEIVADLDLKVRALRWQATGTRLKIGISPHAPYTVRSELMHALAEYAVENDARVCIHASESLAEAELMLHGTGTIAESFARRGIEWNPPGKSTVAYLRDHGILSPRTLLVHGTQISAGDREHICATGAAWAHCPKSNAKLGNGIMTLGLMQGCYPQCAPRVGLGSDSVASNNTMDLFEEMRFAVLLQRARARRFDAMTARQAVEMATIGGARALGLDSVTGSLVGGKQADITAVRLDSWNALPAYDPYNALVYASTARDVLFTMIGGEVRYDGGSFPGADLSPTLSRFHSAVGKMRTWTPA